MAIDTWIAYLLASLLIAISPGSGAILAMSHGLSYGVGKTQATIAGLQTGLLVILLVAGAGVVRCWWRLSWPSASSKPWALPT